MQTYSIRKYGKNWRADITLLRFYLLLIYSLAIRPAQSQSGHISFEWAHSFYSHKVESDDIFQTMHFADYSWGLIVHKHIGEGKSLGIGLRLQKFRHGTSINRPPSEDFTRPIRSSGWGRSTALEFPVELNFLKHIGRKLTLGAGPGIVIVYNDTYTNAESFRNFDGIGNTFFSSSEASSKKLYGLVQVRSYLEWHLIARWSLAAFASFRSSIWSVGETVVTYHVNDGPEQEAIYKFRPQFIALGLRVNHLF